MIDAAKLVAAHQVAQGKVVSQVREQVEVEYARAPEASAAPASGNRPVATQSGSRPTR